MNPSIPAEVPLDDEARAKLRELGIVSLEQITGAALAVPRHFDRLVGAEAAQRFRLYLATRLPPPADSGDDIAERHFSFGARLDEPQAPLPLSEAARRLRDLLAEEARDYRLRGETDKAVELEAALQQWLQTRQR